MISENWLPGWQAAWRTAGGTQRLPVSRADLAFLAVPLPPGAGTLDLLYSPISIRGGFLNQPGNGSGAGGGGLDRPAEGARPDVQGADAPGAHRELKVAGRSSVDVWTTEDLDH